MAHIPELILHDMKGNVTLLRGNIFNSKMQTIVNTVNCDGVMGKGLALAFRLRYPEMYERYRELCRQRLLTVGKLWLYDDDSSQRKVLNFPTKDHWKNPSQTAYIKLGLQKFVATYKEHGITSIAFPMLGTNNGGLDKEEMRPLMRGYLSLCDIPVEIYDYDPDAPDDLIEPLRQAWLTIPPYAMKEVTQIKQQKQIDTIDDLLRHNKVMSMTALAAYPRIGVKTLEHCYRLAKQGSRQIAELYANGDKKKAVGDGE